MQTLNPFKIDLITDGVVEWYASSTGARIQPNTTYTPTIYTTAESTAKLNAFREHSPFEVTSKQSLANAGSQHSDMIQKQSFKFHQN